MPPPENIGEFAHAKKLGLFCSVHDLVSFNGINGKPTLAIVSSEKDIGTLAYAFNRHVKEFPDSGCEFEIKPI